MTARFRAAWSRLMAELRVESGPSPGQTFRLDRDRIDLGRDQDCEARLDSGWVSRHHVRIAFLDGDFYIEDLKSRNGTFVNGQRIEGRRRLAEGDSIRLCDVDLTFRAAAGPVSIKAVRVRSIEPLVVAGGMNIPDYLAPDQVDEHPDRPLSALVDLHAVGVMLYEMLLGESPLPRPQFEKLKAIAERRFTGAVARCAELGFASRLAPIIDRCLAGEAPSALALFGDVVQLTGGRPQVSRRDETSPRPDETFQVRSLLFEDTVSEAYEAIGTASQVQVTLRLFKPAFDALRYAALIEELISKEISGPPVAAPAAILRRYAGGRARPVPVHVGNEIELDRNLAASGCLCLVEEFAGNRTLMAAIQEGRLVRDEPRIAAIICQILQALAFAHDRRAIHANLTPYCIFLGPDDVVKVEGFGLHAEVEQLRIAAGGDCASVSSADLPHRGGLGGSTEPATDVSRQLPPSSPGSSAEGGKTAAEILAKYMRRRTES